MFSFANHSLPSGAFEISGRKLVDPGCAPSNTSKVLTFNVTSGRSHHRFNSEAVDHDEATLRIQPQTAAIVPQ